MQWTHSLHQQYGPVVRVAPNRVSIADPDAIKHIYNIKKPYYKTEFYSSYNGPDLTSTFSGRDPSAHQQSRRLLGAAMTESSLIANMEDTLREHVARWRSQLVTAFATKGFADIYVWNLCLATDFISTATFGSSFDMLNQGPEPRKHQYIQDLIAHPFFRYLRGIVPLLHTAQRWIPLPVCRQMVGIEQRRKASAREFLARRQRDSTDPSSASLQGPSLFTKYYAENEKGAHGIVPDSRLLSEALSYLGAGTDETTNTITVLFWEMAKHPEIQARLSREMNALPEGYRSNELRDAPLLNQVINETLRLDGAASSPLERYVPAGGLTTSDGQHIPAGCAVSVQAWTLHRDATVFEDPERYVSRPFPRFPSNPPLTPILTNHPNAVTLTHPASTPPAGLPRRKRCRTCSCPSAAARACASAGTSPSSKRATRSRRSIGSSRRGSRRRTGSATRATSRRGTRAWGMRIWCCRICSRVILRVDGVMSS